MATEDIIYPLAAFSCALFVLEFGADKFVDHTAIVARRVGVDEGVVALLTAGAEWEELAVVVICLQRGKASLALGNVVGSSVSNVLGAFSLGLIFAKSGEGEDGEVGFGGSSRFYSVLLLGLTVLVGGLLAFGERVVGKAVGGILIAAFGVYVLSIARVIHKGRLAKPEDSDSDSDSSDDEDEHRVSEEERLLPTADEGAYGTNDTEQQTTHRERGPKHSLTYHIALLLIGFLALVLSAYVLSHSATSLIDALGISDVTFGVVVLSIATTLPEKFIAVVSGARGHTGIMVANTVGSNIFLLTLCLGVLWVSTNGEYDHGGVGMVEIGVMLGSAVAMTFTVWFGARWKRVLGAGMAVAYVSFLVLEFAIVRK